MGNSSSSGASRRPRAIPQPVAPPLPHYIPSSHGYPAGVTPSYYPAYNNSSSSTHGNSGETPENSTSGAPSASNFPPHVPQPAGNFNAPVGPTFYPYNSSGIVSSSSYPYGYPPHVSAQYPHGYPPGYPSLPFPSAQTAGPPTPLLPAPEHQQTATIKNDVNISRGTLHLQRDPKDQSKFLIAFSLDAAVDGMISILPFAREDPSFGFSSLSPSLFPPLRLPFKRGFGQKFLQPEGTGYDLSLITPILKTLESQNVSQGHDIIHVVLRLEARPKESVDLILDPNHVNPNLDLSLDPNLNPHHVNNLQDSVSVSDGRDKLGTEFRTEMGSAYDTEKSPIFPDDGTVDLLGLGEASRGKEGGGAGEERRNLPDTTSNQEVLASPPSSSSLSSFIFSSSSSSVVVSPQAVVSPSPAPSSSLSGPPQSSHHGVFLSLSPGQPLPPFIQSQATFASICIVCHVSRGASARSTSEGATSAHSAPASELAKVQARSSSAIVTEKASSRPDALDSTSAIDFSIKAEKQKLWADGVKYELQEIYGIEHMGGKGKGDREERKGEGEAEGKEGEDEEDGGSYNDDDEEGKECVICLTEPRDTTVLPCRHMCMCSDCAKVLRYQTNRCPICRQVIERLLEIRIPNSSNK